jgi:putative tryptophan/tyrosine transport system substrate-binding protein
MKRREFITLLGGAAAWPRVARAQQGKLPRVGYLSPSSAASGFVGRDNAFRQGLSELGYVEGKNFIIEYRFADGQFDRLAMLAAELVALNVDIIVAVVTQASVVAKEATATIPIVMVAVSDPLGSGLVPSLARPGGNVTSTSTSRRRPKFTLR